MKPLLPLLLALAACRSPVPAGHAAIVWHPHFAGIELADIVVDQPKPLRLNAARIDLRAPGVRFQASPGLPDRSRPALADRSGETLSSTTSAWLTRAGCQLAFNASAYAPLVDEPGQPQDVEGLHVADGRLVSPQQDGRDMLLITADNRVRIARPPADVTGVHNAVAGFEIVVQDGKPVSTNPHVAPRTAVGVTADGNTMVVLVVDGRQPGYSEGVTLAELGAWLVRLGAHDALNLDGGGSSTLVVAEGGKARVVNRPIHRREPGRERPSANHVCVFAAGLR